MASTQIPIYKKDFAGMPSSYSFLAFSPTDVVWALIEVPDGLAVLYPAPGIVAIGVGNTAALYGPQQLYLAAANPHGFIYHKQGP